VKRARLGVLRMTAVGLSLLLWLWVTVERRGERPAEKIVDATVTYNPPPGMMILDPQGTVRVRLRGSERAIRRVNPFQIDVQVVVSAERAGPVEVRLQPENVMMPEGLEVVSIEPTVLQLHVDQEVRRLLPVEVPLVGEPAASAELAGKPRVTPAEVLVTGPRKVVEAISAVRSNPISLDGHAFDFQESALLLVPDPLLQLETQVVTVAIPMQQPHPVAEPTPTPRRRG
jgi:YbbR domain-containing protein